MTERDSEDELRDRGPNVIQAIKCLLDYGHDFSTFDKTNLRCNYCGKVVDGD